MENIDLEKAKDLPIGDLYNLQQMAESMIRIYTEDTPRPDDVKRWQDKLKAINEILNSKIVHFKYSDNESKVACHDDNFRNTTKVPTETTCITCMKILLDYYEKNNN